MTGARLRVVGLNGKYETNKLLQWFDRAYSRESRFRRAPETFWKMKDIKQRRWGG